MHVTCRICKRDLCAPEHRSSNIQLTITKSNCALLMSLRSGLVITIRLNPKALADCAEVISLTAFLSHLLCRSALPHTTLQQQAGVVFSRCYMLKIVVFSCVQNMAERVAFTMRMPLVERLAVMRHVARTATIAIIKHVQICFCCPRLAIVHIRHFLCLYRACRRSVSAKCLLRYESRADSIAVTRVTELVLSLAREFDK